MTKPDAQAFDQVAGEYQQKAVAQHRAAQKLLKLLDLKGHEDVLDVGCGPGHITDMIKSLTTGRVAGTDISEGMIAAAREQYPRLEFQIADAQALEYREEFDLVFCNSALQWFPDPGKALQAMHRALRPGGRLGVSCPAGWPTFEAWVKTATQDPELSALFAHWRNPWFILPEAGDYGKLFEKAGFTTGQLEMAEETMYLQPERAFQVYLSGAANGYTGAMYYDTAVPADYPTQFNGLVRRIIMESLGSSKIPVEFKRVYYTGKKQ